jgi:flavin-binding protein dodecin
LVVCAEFVAGVEPSEPPFVAVNNLEETMPVTTKRSRKVVPLKGRGGMTGRDGAIDFAAKAALMNVHVANPDEHIYRVIEIVGTSEQSIEDAITSAVARAHKTLRNLRWFEVLRTSGHIVNGAVAHYQVTLKVGFTMENSI